MTYATAAQYETYHNLTAGAAPVSIDRLLRVASNIVDVILKGRVYDVVSGLPTATADIEALRDATCAIAGEADAHGTLTPGGTQRWESVKIATVALSGPSKTDAPEVAGVPVSADALLSLAQVGRLVVYR